MFQERSTSIPTLHLARNGVLATIFGVAFLVAACGGGGGGDAGPGWTTAALLEEANGSVARPEVVVDAENNATVVWTQFDGASDRIYARRYNSGGVLSAVVELSDVSRGVMGPQIGVDGAGNVFAVWSQVENQDPLSMSIQSSIYSPGTDSWSDSIALVTKDGNVLAPRIAVDASGTATVIWREQDADYNQDIYACRFTASTSCTPVQLTHLAANGVLGALDVAAGPNNKAMAVWTAYPQGATATHVWTGYFNGSGWSMTNIDGGGDSDSPHVAFDGAGNAMVVWTERTGDESAGTPYYVRSLRYVAGTGPGTGWEAVPLILDADGAGSAADPCVAFDNSGNALLVWDVELGGGTGRIRFSRKAAGSGWGDLAYLDGGSGANYGADLTVDGSGNITIAWTQSTATYKVIVANRYEAAGGWGGATTISAANQGDAREASVAADSRGRAIAVWEQENAAGTTTDGWFSVYQ